MICHILPRSRYGPKASRSGAERTGPISRNSQEAKVAKLQKSGKAGKQLKKSKKLETVKPLMRKSGGNTSSGVMS
jgi:hypothetical protein